MAQARAGQCPEAAHVAEGRDDQGQKEEQKREAEASRACRCWVPGLQADRRAIDWRADAQGAGGIVQPAPRGLQPKDQPQVTEDDGPYGHTHAPGVERPPGSLVAQGEGSSEVAADTQGGQEAPTSIEWSEVDQGEGRTERGRQGPDAPSQGLHRLQGQRGRQQEIRAAQVEGIDQAGGEAEPGVGHGARNGQGVEWKAQHEGSHIEGEGELRGQVHGAPRAPHSLPDLRSPGTEEQGLLGSQTGLSTAQDARSCLVRSVERWMPHRGRWQVFSSQAWIQAGTTRCQPSAFSPPRAPLKWSTQTLVTGGRWNTGGQVPGEARLPDS